MKKKITIVLFLVLTFMLISVFPGCTQIKKIFDKTPEEYIEGIIYDRDYPDDALEIYDDAIVFKSDSRFDEIVLSCGTQDDIDDIVDFYHDFFEDNEIVLEEYEEGRNNFYASGISEDYFFKIEVEKADSEYIEDVFEYVIYISVKELSDEQINDKALKSSDENNGTAVTASSDAQSSTPTPKPTNTPSPTKTPSPTSDDISTKYIDYGTWTVTAAYDNTDEIYITMSIHIENNTNGTMYFFSYDNDSRWYEDFTYTLSNGYITFSFADDSVLEYYSTYDDGILSLENSEYLITEYYLLNWNDAFGIYPSNDVFTAYGNWMYYNPDDGHIETVAFWPNGNGSIYNWGGNGKTLSMSWEYNDGTFSIYDENSKAYDFDMLHRGDVFELIQAGGNRFFYHRVVKDYLTSGAFVLEDTNDPTVDDFTLFFNIDFSAQYSINNEADVQSYWYIERSDGTMNIEINGNISSFNYQYNLYGLLLIDISTGYYYEFIQVG